MESTVRITLNGERREVPGPLSVAELLKYLGLKPEHVAVEVNKDLITRSRQAETVIAQGDVLEVVTLVGGGGPRRLTSSRCRSVPTWYGAGCSSGRVSMRPWS